MFREQKAIPAAAGVQHQRWVMTRGLALAAPVAALAWFAIYRLVPPLNGMQDAAARLGFAVQCCCVAALLCLLPAIEAVAHRRFGPSAIDPLGAQATRRMKVDSRHLQHTIEQLLLFVPGVVGLATWSADGAQMRAVLATTLTWIAARAVFRLGYHAGPATRGAGLIGMVQSVIVLMYVSARWGYSLAGIVGACAPVALAFFMEAYIIARSRR